MYHVVSTGGCQEGHADKGVVMTGDNQKGGRDNEVIITGQSLTATIEGIRWALSSARLAVRV